ncbi:Ubiquitin carboxyl-terminal hydrolase 24 [Nymphaea thermarum]|nr:Ubiquitin carboxyl-terminal hydrolase 24 [Nymphaea thermarum]
MHGPVGKFTPDLPANISGRPRQEDAQEFVSFVMDQMHDELLKLEGHLSFSDGGRSSLVSSAEDDDWETVGPKNKTAVTRTQSFVPSELSDIFGGQLRSVVKARGSMLDVQTNVKGGSDAKPVISDKTETVSASLQKLNIVALKFLIHLMFMEMAVCWFQECFRSQSLRTTMVIVGVVLYTALRMEHQNMEAARSLKLIARDIPKTGYPTLHAFTELISEFEASKDLSAKKNVSAVVDVGKLFSPAMFESVLKKFTPDLPANISGRPRQEDAQEFLSFVMDQMHDELLKLEVRMLRSGTETTVVGALNALLVLESDDATSSEAMAESGAVEALLELLKSHQCEETAARLLESLLNNVKIRESKAAKSAISPLSQYLNEPPSQVQQAKLLVALALGDLFQNEALARSTDAVSACRALVNLIEEQPTEEMKVVAICALQNLVMYSRSNKRAVAEAGGIQIVIDIVSSSEPETSVQAATFKKEWMKIWLNFQPCHNYMQMQCVSYEKRIQELEQRLFEQYLQGHHVTDEKNASQSSLKNDNYGSVISAGTEGQGPYGSSDPMDEPCHNYKQMQCVSYEKRIQELEQRLSEQYLQVHHVTDEKNASQSSLKIDNYGSVISAGTEGPGPYGSSDPMDEMQCVSYEKRIQELEQRLSEQYLQVHHVTDEKNASQSSLKNDNYGLVISAGTEGPGPYGSSDPMDEELEQRLSEQYLQVHHVTDEKNASQSSLKIDNYGSVISAGTEGPGPYGSSDPMDEELEQRLSEQYLQVHHVTDEKNASQSSLKNDNYGSVISAGTKGPGSYGSSDPNISLSEISHRHWR